jgi:penicillin-insensitive murein endopeptidase
MRRASLAFVLLWASSGVALALASNPWAAFREPFAGPPRAIGEYSAGCLQGAQPLPLEGVGYQVMRPARHRYFGHPALVEFVVQLAQKLSADGPSMLLIGDLSQPRGGRAPGSHASHQTGLDVDIWYWHPAQALHALLSPLQRERIAARSVVDVEGGKIRPAARTRVQRMVRAAAQDPRLDRLFVHPVIKRELCSMAGKERGYLRKVRPWHGHDDHFHARLACPAGSEGCKAQEPVPAGDGCADLAFWFDAEAQAARKQAQSQYQRNVDEGRGWPDACEPLLRATAESSTGP